MKATAINGILISPEKRRYQGEIQKASESFTRKKKGLMMNISKLRTYFAAGLVGLTMGATPASAVVPNPVLYLTGIESYSVNGQNFIRYRYDVLNKDQYPADMFAAAPNLPPCGSNTSSSRSWVDFFNGRTNARLYGFCALGSPNNLGQIWFSVPDGTVPPSYVYIKITDRQTNTTYQSNLADTVP